MDVAIKAVMVCFGGLFFLTHLAWAIYSVRFFEARDEKLEVAGKVVPGLAGLLMIPAALLSSSGWAILCAVLALPLLIVGRAAYELIVFRRRAPAHPLRKQIGPRC